METAVIVSGARTPVGSFGGALKGVKVVDLGALVIREAIKRAGLRPGLDELSRHLRPHPFADQDKTELNRRRDQFDPSLPAVYFDECIMGNVLQAGQGQNPARQAAIYAGLPEETNAWTLNMVCASGMRAVASAALAIQTGAARAVIAGGMENMSAVPYGLPEARFGYRMNMPHGQVTDLMVFDGLYEIFYGYHMGQTAENIARLYAIKRKDQDELALLSHRRALAATASGVAAEEIVPVAIPQKKGEPVLFATDERPQETSLEKLAKLPPAFLADGTVTAGNASGINDGAAALVIMAQSLASELGLKPLAKIKGFAMGGIDPAYMGLGPIPAVKKLFHKLQLTMADMDVVELNEAFACQALACIRELGVDIDRCNPHGSGISLGHPIGATGARITLGLAMEMKRKDASLGLASLCIGGGQGMALILER
jgi:acetyl-CoA C-acetyltransferase